MGSTRKHKKEKKHRKHRREGPSDNEDDPEEKRPRREEEEKKKHSKHNKSHHKSSRRSERDDRRDSPGESSSRNRDRSQKSVQELKVPRQQEDAAATNGGKGLSLSVEETNNLRVKLGLKPLDNSSSDTPGNGEEKASDFVHAPAEDLWKKKKQDEMREKLRTIKEKRSLNKKLNKVKALGEEEEDDVSSWVEKSRISENKKKLAVEREKQLAAMDEEFGVGGLVDKEFHTQKKYTAKDLKGIGVEHSLEMFKEGRSVILTLKDKDILDEDNEDILMNVNIQDQEKTQKSLDNKTRGIGYRAYEEEEVDELGFIKVKSMLSKYDEEIEGERKDKFVIGSNGSIDISWEQQKEHMKKEIRAQGISLAMPEFKIASEYLTEEEMIKFKKKKKRVGRKTRKRETFKADDLIPLPGQSTSTSDLGSRGRSGNIPGWDEGAEAAKVDQTSITSTTIAGSQKSVIVDEDDAGNELQKALDKARKVKQMTANRSKDDLAAVKVAQHLEVLNSVPFKDPSADYSAVISLNSTDEFCRQLGQMPTEMSTVKEEAMEEDMPDIMNVDMEIEDQSSSGWNFVQSEMPVPIKAEENDDSHAPIEAEPLATGGLMGALKLAGRKGYLLEETSANKGSVITNANLKTLLESKNYSIEDKNAVDHLDKYAHEKYSRDRNRHDRGIVTDFEEKKNYKPTIKIDYVDEGGRLMNPKEAFRKLSHRFHGKGSGKMKQEKRQKKKAEEDMMMRMSSTDTPLNTVAMMKEKLHSEASPYIILSGAGKTLQAGGPGLMSKTK